jgi:dihydrofolate reductase
MRKLIVEEWISLDGYAADRNGTTDFFPSTEENRYSDEDQLRFLEGIDTILLGRKTYDLFVDFWPTDKSKQEIIAPRLNEIRKVVFSNTIKNASWGKWPDATVVPGDAVDAVRNMKQDKGKSIVLWGSISLTQALMKADLIDEYHIQIIPIRLGAGRLLFPQEEENKELRLIGNKMYEATGVMYLKYVPNIHKPIPKSK